MTVETMYLSEWLASPKVDRRVEVGARLVRIDGRWRLRDAGCDVAIVIGDGFGDDDLCDGDLVWARIRQVDSAVVADDITVVHRPDVDGAPLSSRSSLPIQQVLEARDELYYRIRNWMRDEKFVEVDTPSWVRAPGTDPHIEPMPARFFEEHGGEDDVQGYLRTSPEFAMKRLLAAGAGPIYQLGKAFRNGEVTDQHSPEFTILEWYRPWRDVEAIIDDVERLVVEICDGESARPVEAPIERMTMQQVVDAACGFDILEALDVESLRRRIEDLELLSGRHMEAARWDELFFSLTVNHIDPFLADRGAVFVTDWPAPLAILARRDDADRRVAKRFELYVDGIELANGFGELTDPDEQQRRFDEDNQIRGRMGRPQLPVAHSFIRALRWGLPPSAGVALGVDRLLMLRMPGASTIGDVNPFAPLRDFGQIRWP